MKFTDAMRSKARLSITGSASENGRVPVAYLRPGLPMSLSMTDLSWPCPSQCLTANRHTSFLSLKSKWKCLSSPSVTNNTHRVWSSVIFNLEFSQSYLLEDFWSCSLTSSLKRLAVKCKQSLPTYKVTWLSARKMAHHLQIHEKQSSTVDSFLNKHASLFRRFLPWRLFLYRK